MIKRLKPTPVLTAALGAAVSYYGVAGKGWLWIPEVLLIMLVSLIGTLIQGPSLFFVSSEGLRIHFTFRRAAVYGIALSLGFSLGLGAGVSRPVRLGLPEARVIGMRGILQDDPRRLHYGRGMGNLRLQSVSGTGGIRTSAQGTIPIVFPEEAVPRLKEFGRGSTVYIEGAMLSGGKELRFRAQSVHILRPAPKLEQFRTSLRGYFIQRFAGYPWGGLALALLLGVKDNLDMELAKSYLNAGCAHVLALSGMHLAIAAAVIAFLLKKPLGLKAAALTGSVCIFAYVYLVGSLPSLDRAAIMYGLGTLVILKSLPRQPVSILAMAFLIQISVNPESGHTISFILSYLALGGILSIGGIIYDLIRGKVPEVLAQPLSASLGAFIAAAPAAAFFFGVQRPIGIIAGLVIVPLTTVFMICAMIFLALDFLSFLTPALPFMMPFWEMILSVLYDILERLIALCALAPGIPSADPVPVLAGSVGLSAVFIVLYIKQHALRRNLAPFD